MSGHSKWATIKRQKGLNDQKKGQVFTKLSNAITIAVKQGGGNADPEFNAPLRLAIDKAKTANMPRDGIEKAVFRGTGDAGGLDLLEVLYECFSYGGVGILIEAVTDKKQRTVAEVKSTIEKNGGTLAGQGAVSYLFERVGEIVVLHNGKSTEEILAIALDHNVTDYDDDEEATILYTDPGNLQAAKIGIEEAGLIVNDAGLVYRPMSYLTVDSEKLDKIMLLVDKLESLDDVQKVYTNLE